MTLYLDGLRGVKLQQDGEDLADAAKIEVLNFRDQVVDYNPATGVASIGPELSSTRAEVEAATTAALAANTRSGNTLTANANGAIGSIDGVALTTNSRVLVKNEATTANNGWYYVADPGSASTPWILTRTTDADASAEFVSGSTSRVLAGSVNGNKTFVLTVPGGFTLNADAVTFTELVTGNIYDPHSFGALGDGSTDDTAALQAAIDAAEVSGGIVRLAAKEYAYTALTIDSNGVVIEGTGDMGDTGSVLVKTSTTGDGVTVTAQNSGLRNVMMKQLSSGAPPTAGYAVVFGNCFTPILENVRISEMYDGVSVTGTYEARLQGTLWLRAMFGTVGLDVDGASGFAQRIIADNPYQASTDGKSHAARQTSHAYVVGDTYTNNSLIFQVTGAGTSSGGGGPTTVPGSTVANARSTDVTDGTATVRFIGRLMDWTKFGPSVAGFTVQSAALLNGYRGIRQTGGNWVFFNHAELDHQWASGISLDSGSGLRIQNFWISSVFTGDGISVGTGYTGDVGVANGRIYGCAERGVLLQPGPVDCRFENLLIDTCAGLAGFLAGESGGTGPKHFAFRNSRVKNCNYGVAALSSDADYFHVTGNDCQGNSTGVDMSGASGSNKVVTNNI